MQPLWSIAVKDFLKVRLAAAAIALAALFAPVAAMAQGFTLPDNSVIQGHIRAVQQPGATPPTAVGCTIAPNATDAVGTCTATAASGTITFSRTQGAAPTCVVWDQSATSTVSMPVYTVTATAITLATIISTHVLGYICIGTIAGS
jgi:hypothetical protein